MATVSTHSWFQDVNFHFANGESLAVDSQNPIYKSAIVQQALTKTTTDDVKIKLPSNFRKDLMQTLIELAQKQNVTIDSTVIEELFRYVEFFRVDPSQYQWDPLQKVKTRLYELLANTLKLTSLDQKFSTASDPVLKKLYDTVFVYKVLRCKSQQVDALLQKMETATGPLFKKWLLAARFSLGLLHQNHLALEKCLDQHSYVLFQHLKRLFNKLIERDKDGILNQGVSAVKTLLEKSSKVIKTTHLFSWIPIKLFPCFVQTFLANYENIRTARKYEKLTHCLDILLRQENRGQFCNDLHAILQGTKVNFKNPLYAGEKKNVPIIANFEHNDILQQVKTNSAKILIQTVMRVAVAALLTFATMSALLGAWSYSFLPATLLTVIIFFAGLIFHFAMDVSNVTATFDYYIPLLFLVVGIYALVNGFHLILSAELLKQLKGILVLLLSALSFFWSSFIDMDVIDELIKKNFQMILPSGLLNANHDRLAKLFDHVSEWLAPYLLKII